MEFHDLVGLTYTEASKLSILGFDWYFPNPFGYCSVAKLEFFDGHGNNYESPTKNTDKVRRHNGESCPIVLVLQWFKEKYGIHSGIYPELRNDGTITYNGVYFLDGQRYDVSMRKNPKIYIERLLLDRLIKVAEKIEKNNLEISN